MSFREFDDATEELINYEQRVDNKLVNELCNIYDQTKQNTYRNENANSEALKMSRRMPNTLTLQTSSSEGSNQTQGSVTVRSLIDNQLNNSGISEEKSGKMPTLDKMPIFYIKLYDIVNLQRTI